MKKAAVNSAVFFSEKYLTIFLYCDIIISIFLRRYKKWVLGLVFIERC